MTRSTRLSVLGLLALSFGTACAAPGPPAQRGDSRHASRAAAARAAEAQVGAPYLYGGSSPDGFDCSGLVVYSYRKAGLAGLPHSAAALDAISQKVPLQKIEPGDLLFFQLGGSRAKHVAIYVGRRAFVHAPSSGKRVEKATLDHQYWGKKAVHAGRPAR